jgi:hypothetical protein
MSQSSIRDLVRQFAGQHNTLTIQRPYIEFAGSVEGGLFLSQLLYWADRAREDGWFYKSYQEWESEIYLKEKPLRAIAQKFSTFLERKTKKNPAGNPTIHYRINWEAFTAEFTAFLQAPKATPIGSSTFGRNEPDDLAGTNQTIMPERTSTFGRKEADDLAGTSYIHQLHTSTTPSTTASKSSAEKRMKVDFVKVEVIEPGQQEITLPVNQEEERKGPGGAVAAIVPAKPVRTSVDRQNHALMCTARQDEDYVSFRRFYSRISNVVSGNIGNGQAAEEEWMLLKAEGYEIGPAFWDGLDAFKGITIAKFKVEGKVVGFQGMRNFIRDKGWESALEAQAMQVEIEASGFKAETEKSKFQKSADQGKETWARVMEKMKTGELNVR